MPHHETHPGRYEGWAREVPEHYWRRRPYEDYGWESRQSVLPEWRDPSVHRMPYEQGGPYPGRGQAYGPPYGGEWSMRAPYGERVPEVATGLGLYGGDYEFGRPDVVRMEPVWSYSETWVIPGPFVGRGPRGYQRSDERICEDVCERLMRHGYIDARDIEVTVDNGEVTLAGTVDSRGTKRMVEDVVESVPGVMDVHNRLQLRELQEQRELMRS